MQKFWNEILLKKQLKDIIERNKKYEKIWSNKLKWSKKRRIRRRKKRDKYRDSKKMKTRGMDVDTIIEITGLAKEEIEKL